MLALLFALAAQTFSDDSITLPPVDGWTKQDAANKSVVYVPPGLAPEIKAALILVPSEASSDSAAEYHAKSLKAATNGLKVTETLKTGDRGSFLFSNLALEIPGGKKAWTAIYTTRWGGRGQTAVFFCDDEAAWHFNLGRVEVTFMDAAVPNPLLAPGADVVPIVELYLGVALEIGTVFRNGELTRQTLPTKKWLALYKNGLALRVDALSNGFFGSTYRGFGLASFDAAALVKEPKDDRVGKWTEADGKITVDWTIGKQEIYTRGEKVLDGPKHWTRFPSVDGARPDGTFECKSFYAPTRTLKMTKDGKFEADGVNATMGGKGSNPLFPEKGAGTYEIRAHTLILRFDNGYRTSIALLFEGDSLEKTPQIVLNGTPFDRTVQ